MTRLVKVVIERKPLSLMLDTLKVSAVLSQIVGGDFSDALLARAASRRNHSSLAGQSHDRQNVHAVHVIILSRAG